jgi:hypothetical protein
LELDRRGARAGVSRQRLFRKRPGHYQSTGSPKGNRPRWATRCRQERRCRLCDSRITGVIGAGLGAWGASEVVDWIEKYKINNQADSTGRVWTFDPAHPEKGWTHSEREIVGTVGTLADRPIYGPTTLLTADAELTQQLNYQASSSAVGLRMREPDQPINPFSIAGDATDTPSALPRSWERVLENGEWRGEVVHQVLEHGIRNTTVEVASAAVAYPKRRCSSSTPPHPNKPPPGSASQIHVWLRQAARHQWASSPQSHHPLV